jgi:AcrR family transcriptional regulator
MPIMSSSKNVTKRSHHLIASKRSARKTSSVARAVAAARPGPEGGVRQENRRKRIEELRRSACTLFLEQGLSSVSVEEIASAAGLSKAGFYRYFPSIDALVEALFAPIAEGIEDAASTAEIALRAARNKDQLVAVYLRLGIALTALVATEQDVVRLYLQEVRAPAHGLRLPVSALARRLDVLVLALTHAAHARGLLRAVDPELSGQAVLGLVEHMLHRSLRSGRLVQDAERLPALIGMVLEGVARGE